MNFQKLYSDSVGRKAKQELEEASQSPAEQAFSAQAKLNWQNSTITQKMVESLSAEVANYLDQAVTLACSYPQHNNHQQIINLLVRSNEIRNILNTYAEH